MLLNIAIYNGFPFHYEMFGFILQWCRRNNFDCSIYTTTTNNNGWLDYYQQKFPSITYNECDQFIKDAHLYHIVILITDNDHSFETSWLNLYGIHQKIIRLNHVPYDRYPEIKYSIDVRNFTIDKPYVNGFFNIINYKEKEKLVITDSINIFISANLYHYDTKNLQILDKYPNTILHFIARKIDPKFKQDFKSTNQYHENISTSDMIAIISKCQYMFFGLDNDSEFRYNRISGFIILSYSCCTPIIMDAKTYLAYNLKSPISYKNNVTEIFNIPVNYKNIQNERKKSYTALDNYMKQWRPSLFQKCKIIDKLSIPKTINFMWLDKSRNNSDLITFPDKYKRNIDTYKKYNPDYVIKIWNFKEIDRIIKKYLPEFYQLFITLTPWISKCDFARFCVVYIYGGIYSDLDFYCSKHLDSLLYGKDHVLAFEPKEHGVNFLYNGFFAAAPKSKFIYGWLQTMQVNAKLEEVMIKSGPIGLGSYYNMETTIKPQLTETHKIILYNDKHNIIDDIGDLDNINDNYVYTVWKEGTGWGYDNVNATDSIASVSSVSTTSSTSWQYAWVGIIIGILILIILIYFLVANNASY